jgi:hypothetical protein
VGVSFKTLQPENGKEAALSGGLAKLALDFYKTKNQRDDGDRGDGRKHNRQLHAYLEVPSFEWHVLLHQKKGAPCARPETVSRFGSPANQAIASLKSGH